VVVGQHVMKTVCELCGGRKRVLCMFCALVVVWQSVLGMECLFVWWCGSVLYVWCVYCVVVWKRVIVIVSVLCGGVAACYRHGE